MLSQIIHYGTEEAQMEHITLCAGPLASVYENGDLRYVCFGKHEILRRVYVAVRDHNWDTIPAILSNVVIETGVDSFHISYEAQHKRADIDFFWRGTISGATDGTIIFDMDGECRSTFRRNRIGFCVLHPMARAGEPCSVEGVEGAQEDSIFPRYISPHQPFKGMRAITHKVAPGLRAEVRMEGDTFEMEDQRNWTDASFKTYCTPLELSFPVTVQKGMKIAQRVTLSLSGEASLSVADSRDLTFTLSDAPTMPLPRTGLGLSSDGDALTAIEIDRLRQLNPAHLRAGFRLSGFGVEEKLRRAAHEADALGVGLEAALFLSDDAEAELKSFRALLDVMRPVVYRWLVFHDDEKSTREQWVQLARKALVDYNAGAQFGAGSNAYFTEVNRERPPVHALDFVSYSINPQVHAFDIRSLVETLEAQAVTVESVRQFSGELPLVISPVTLKPRYNPNATGPDALPEPGELPAQVDVRQMSLLGAGWTAGSFKYLAESSVDFVTYFETCGWRGVMEREGGAPLPEKFPSIRGGVFPLYHVLADVGEFAGGEVIPTHSNRTLSVDGLALHKDGRTRTILANFTSEMQRVTVQNLVDSVRVKQLDERNAEASMRAPETFRARLGDPQKTASGALGLELWPYAVATIDSERAIGR